MRAISTIEDFTAAGREDSEVEECTLEEEAAVIGIEAEEDTITIATLETEAPKTGGSKGNLVSL